MFELFCSPQPPSPHSQMHCPNSWLLRLCRNVLYVISERDYYIPQIIRVPWSCRVALLFKVWSTERGPSENWLVPMHREPGTETESKRLKNFMVILQEMLWLLTLIIKCLIFVFYLTRACSTTVNSKKLSCSTCILGSTVLQLYSASSYFAKDSSEVYLVPQNEASEIFPPLFSSILRYKSIVTVHKANITSVKRGLETRGTRAGRRTSSAARRGGRPGSPQALVRRRASAAAEGAGRGLCGCEKTPRLRLKKVGILPLPPGRRSASGSAVAAAAVARGLGRGLHCCPRGAGSSRCYLLRPGRQPHVAGLEGRRRRGGQGFLGGECGPGRLGTAGLSWKQAWGGFLRGAGPPTARQRKPTECSGVRGALESAREALPGSPPSWGPRPWLGSCWPFPSLPAPRYPFSVCAFVLGMELAPFQPLLAHTLVWVRWSGPFGLVFKTSVSPGAEQRKLDVRCASYPRGIDTEATFVAKAFVDLAVWKA